MKVINNLAIVKAQLLSIVLLAVSTNAIANNENNDDWADVWVEEVPASPWQVTGFIEAAYGQFLQTNVTKNNASLNELKARVNVDYSHELFDASVKLDSYYDGVLTKTIFQTRELSMSASPFSFLDIKAGRQVLTWGTGDYLFLNDLFAKDWQSFFAGRADEYLKAPSNSIRTNWFYNAVNFTLVWTPEFTPDNYLNGERFSFYSPQAQKIVAPANGFSVDNTHKAQWAARLNTRINDIEVSLYGYQGFWPTPEGTKQSANNTMQSRAYFPALTANMQYYLERTKHYQALVNNSQLPEQLVAENRHLVTLRLSYRALRQTLTYSMFAFYSPSDKDGYLKPSVNYQYNDQWLLSAGANIFFGEDEFSFFGQLEKNTNAWLRARYQY